jgi:hypothetical protein
MLLTGVSPPELATLPPAGILHRFPGFNGVIAQHPAHDMLKLFMS